MIIYGGFFYKYRGNGYGPFRSLNNAISNFYDRKNDLISPLFDIIPHYYVGTIKVDDDKNVLDENLILVGNESFMNECPDWKGCMKIKVFIETDTVKLKIEDIIEIDDNDLKDLNSNEKVEYISRTVDDWKDNHMCWGWEECG